MLRRMFRRMVLPRLTILEACRKKAVLVWSPLKQARQWDALRQGERKRVWVDRDRVQHWHSSMYSRSSRMLMDRRRSWLRTKLLDIFKWGQMGKSRPLRIVAIRSKEQ